MEYVELSLSLKPTEPWYDLVADELGALGFESFLEQDGKLLAYVQRSDFEEEKLREVEILTRSDLHPQYTWQVVPNENWNKKWEENFQPVDVEGKCLIRASFHEPNPEAEFEIIIEPKMAFGTGHHASTFLMVKAMMEENRVVGKTVLDMGSGTGVLAILAKMQGSGDTVAVDNNDWADASTRENIRVNGHPEIETILGEIETVQDRSFDVILANINRNVILDQLALYTRMLTPAGSLLVSGFYAYDAALILDEASKQGLRLLGRLEKNDWCQLTFAK